MIEEGRDENRLLTLHCGKPMGAVRQVRKDRWNPSKAVIRYRAYRDRLREAWPEGLTIPKAGLYLVFFCAAPASDPERIGRAVYPTPDGDNLEKAFFDALLKQDSMIWHIAGRAKIYAAPGNERIELVYPKPI